MDGTSNISNDLFYKVRSRFSGLKLGTETGEITINPEEARFFDFDYKDGEAALGHITISLAEPNSMKVYFSSGITESMEVNQKSRWYSFLKELRSFAKRRLMAFDTRDISKDNLDRRDFEFLTTVGKPNPPTDKLVKQVGESIMNENQLYGTNRMSYQRLMDTRLIIKHSKALQDDQQPGARSRNISALFVENQDGERFKYPFIHLAGARAMQRHVANGGVPYDDLGKSIIEISEQIAQLKNFSNYVVRNDLMNSDTNSIVEQSTMALNSLREKITKLSKQSFYEQYKENFAKAEPVEIPQSMVEEFKEKFTVKSFREEISTVFPLLYKIMQENSSVDYDDIVSMATNEETINDEAEVDHTEDELEKFEQWIMDLGEESSILSDDTQERTQAVEELQKLVGEHFPAGVDGIQAIESLKGIIDDAQLFNEIKEQAKQDPDSCVRPLVKEWLEQNAPEVVQELDFGDMTEGDIDPNKHPQTKDYGRGDDEDDLPFDADDDASDTDEFGNKIKHRAKHLAKKGMRQAMDVKELAEFITSFYDRNTGTFPKGPEGVVTMVGKKFGEQAEQVARKFVERMAPHQEQGAEELAELGRMRELAGVQSAAQEQISNEEKIDWASDDVETVKAMGQEFYVKDTPEGKLLLGDDVEGYFYADHNGQEREGNITFVYNLDTGNFIEFPKDYSQFYGYLDHDEVEDYVKELVDEIKGKMGSNEESVNTESDMSEDSDGVFHVDTKKEDMIDVKVVDYHYDSYAEDIIIELENAETGEPVEITDITSGRAEIENWVQDRMQKEKDDRDYSEDSGEELDRIRKLSGIAQGLGY
jgi:hypothetical protein